MCLGPDYTKSAFEDLGLDTRVITAFQRYTQPNLTPRFSPNFSEVTFSLERGTDTSIGNLKISKGEESNFIWSVFYCLLDQVISTRIREAFNQIHRYSKESFNSDSSFFKYLQIFVISNGTDTRYFANTTKRDKNSFDFTMNWAQADNSLIRDLKDFTATFFEKRTLLKVLLDYSVFDVSDTLLVMRPYQIAATERLLRKIRSSFEAKTLQGKVLGKPESGGYIWHTTGSGKTLTSFKAARLSAFVEKFKGVGGKI